jgi:hypothetical protein
MKLLQLKWVDEFFQVIYRVFDGIPGLVECCIFCISIILLHQLWFQLQETKNMELTCVHRQAGYFDRTQVDHKILLTLKLGNDVWEDRGNLMEAIFVFERQQWCRWAETKTLHLKQCKWNEHSELTARHEWQLAVVIPRNWYSMDCTTGSTEKMMLNPRHRCELL